MLSDLPLEGKRCELVGWVTMNVSSTSGSGGPGGRTEELGFDGLGTVPSLPS